MDYLLWTDDEIWSDNPYLWNHVVEITAISGNIHGYVDVRRRQERYKPKKQQSHKDQPVEEQKTITLICIVDDAKFEKTNYINKKLKVEMFEEEFTIIEAKHMPHTKAEDVNWRVSKNTNNEIKITVSNVQVI